MVLQGQQWFPSGQLGPDWTEGSGSSSEEEPASPRPVKLARGLSGSGWGLLPSPWLNTKVRVDLGSGWAPEAPGKALGSGAHP